MGIEPIPHIYQANTLATRTWRLLLNNKEFKHVYALILVYNFDFKLFCFRFFIYL